MDAPAAPTERIPSDSLARRAGAFVVAVARRFYADQCLMYASALAYTSLLSLVPLLALMFAVLKGLGVQHRLEPVLLSRLNLNSETTELIVGYIDRTNVSTLGALGAALLVVTVIGVLGTIESSFNHIWRVTQPRSLWRQVTDYLGVVLLTPLLLLAGVAITSAGQVQQIMQWLFETEYVGVAATRFLALSPIVINATAIGVLYAIMPNRRPVWRPIVISAVIAGIAWQLVQWTYVSLQVGVARNSAIYGALAQLPVTLVWIYVSWLIILGGAEIAALLEFGAAAWRTARAEPDPQALALHLLLAAADRFADGSGAVQPREVARLLTVRVDALQPVTAALRELGWLAALESNPDELILARAPERIELRALSALERGDWVPPRTDPRAKTALAEALEKRPASWGNRTLADLLPAAARATTPVE